MSPRHDLGMGLTKDKYDALYQGCLIVAAIDGMQFGGDTFDFWIDCQSHCLFFAKAQYPKQGLDYSVELHNGFTESQLEEIIDLGEEFLKEQIEESDRVMKLIPQLKF